MFIDKIDAHYIVLATKYTLPKGVVLDAHGTGNTLTIDWYTIPKAMRGKGLGKKIYLEWEKALPKKYKFIKLFAADSGEGKSNNFWESAGFDYAYNIILSEADLAWWMQKGVNGSQTPKAKNLYVILNDTGEWWGGTGWVRDYDDIDFYESRSEAEKELKTMSLHSDLYIEQF